MQQDRKINQANPHMSKHIQFESMLSLTGANADDVILIVLLKQVQLH